MQRVRDAALAMVRSPAVAGDVSPSTSQPPGTTTPGVQKPGDTTTTPSVQKPGDTTIKADQVAQAILSIITALIQQGGAGQVSSGTLANILQTLGSFLKQQQQGSGDDLLAAIKQLTDQLQKTGGVVKPPPANDVTAVLQQVANVLQNVNIAPKATAPGADQQQQAAQLQQVFDFVASIINPSQSKQLGQVNGALGQTIGNLLDGKKTGIGIAGALLTSLLTQASSGSGGVASTLTQIASVIPGLSGYAMPIFLALTAWGVLGKFEKWSQGTAPPPTSTK